MAKARKKVITTKDIEVDDVGDGAWRELYLAEYEIHNKKVLRAKWPLSCCDCGLAHLFIFEVDEDTLRIQVWRDEFGTEILRKLYKYDMTCKKK
jgi:hypothetical protein